MFEPNENCKDFPLFVCGYRHYKRIEETHDFNSRVANKVKE
jgi:hypothetical protein